MAGAGGLADSRCHLGPRERPNDNASLVLEKATTGRAARFLDDQRDERRGVPESHHPESRSAATVSDNGRPRNLGPGRRISLGIRPEPRRRMPWRSSARRSSSSFASFAAPIGTRSAAGKPLTRMRTRPPRRTYSTYRDRSSLARARLAIFIWL